MPNIIDLGGAPAEEECAQLGQTIDFAAVNAFEVEAYRVAIIARFGAPPEDCRLVSYANPHDFGTYRTLTLRVADEPSPAATAYAEAIGDGLARWHDAGMASPVLYVGKNAVIDRRDTSALVVGILNTCRPDSQGKFPLEDFAVISRNLAAAFPDDAAVAHALQGVGWAEAAPKRAIFAYDVPVHVEVEGDRIVRVCVLDDAPIGDDPTFVAGDRDHFDAAVSAARAADHWPAWQFGC